jgi:epoxide hydrolase-like predicted phosphatase
VIKNIIFDLGNVLVKVDIEKSKRLLVNAGVDEKKLNRFLSLKTRKAYESGRIATPEFLKMGYFRLGKKVSKAKLRLLFTDMFAEITEMKKFLLKLHMSGKYRLFLMSNTNPLHFNYARKNFPYINLFDKFILSYKIGFAKPDRRIYRTLLKRYKLLPAESLFIDDLAGNCLAAEKLGIKTILYKNYSSFIKQFRKITK